MKFRKVEVRVFLEPWLVERIDQLLGKLGGTRSEVIRTIVIQFFLKEGVGRR
jgi:metal-responsive CopG/Arc/MetJ family transcriptional regulator